MVHNGLLYFNMRVECPSNYYLKCDNQAGNSSSEAVRDSCAWKRPTTNQQMISKDYLGMINTDFHLMTTSLLPFKYHVY